MTRWLAIATAGATFVLLLAGGLVHGTGSGLACPDWPTCYGSFFPELEGGVLYEHSHRLIATGVGVMTIALAALLWRAGRRGLGAAALALVVVQGVIGGITVLYRLPDLVSTAHLGAGMAFFALVLYAAFVTGPAPAAAAAAAPVPASARRLVGVAAAALYLQIVLGALVRHSESGLACIDWVLCQGQVWPADAHPAARLHMAHRLCGVAVAALVLAAGSALLRARARGAARALALALAAGVVAQVALGVASVQTALSLWAVQAHLGLGALLLGGAFWLWLSLRGAPAPAARGAAAPVPAAEAA